MPAELRIAVVGLADVTRANTELTAYRDVLTQIAAAAGTASGAQANLGQAIRAAMGQTAQSATAATSSVQQLKLQQRQTTAASREAAAQLKLQQEQVAAASRAAVAQMRLQEKQTVAAAQEAARAYKAQQQEQAAAARSTATAAKQSAAALAAEQERVTAAANEAAAALRREEVAARSLASGTATAAGGRLGGGGTAGGRGLRETQESFSRFLQDVEARAPVAARVQAAFNKELAKTREEIDLLQRSPMQRWQDRVSGADRMRTLVAQYPGMASGELGKLSEAQRDLATLQARRELGGMALRGGANVAAGITGLGIASVILDTSFQRKLMDVRTNTTMTAEEMKNLERIVLDLGARSGASFDQLLKGYMHIRNEGFSAAEATRMLEEAMKGAVATGADVEKTANLLAGAVHTFRLRVDDYAKAYNVLHVAAQLGNMTTEQFVEAAGPSLAAAAAMGIKIHDVAAAYSALTRNMFTAAQANTLIRGIIMQIEHPSVQAQKALAGLSKISGIDLVRDFSGAGVRAKGLIGIMEDLSKATHGNADIVIRYLMPAMRGGFGAAVLMKSGFKDFQDVFLQTSRAMAGTLDPTTEQYNARLKTTAQQIDILVNTIKRDFIPVGQEFAKVLRDAMPALETTAHILRDVMGVFTALPKPIQDVIVALGMTRLLGAVAGINLGLGGLYLRLTSVIRALRGVPAAVATAEAATAGGAAAGGAGWASGAMPLLGGVAAGATFLLAPQAAGRGGVMGASRETAARLQETLRQLERDKAALAEYRALPNAQARLEFVQQKFGTNLFGAPMVGREEYWRQLESRVRGDYQQIQKLREDLKQQAGDLGVSIVQHAADAIKTPKGEASCAYFVSEVLRRAGAAVPKTGSARELGEWAAKHAAGRPGGQALPGDLVVWQGARYGAVQDDGARSGYHVGIALGGGLVRTSSGGVARTVPMYDAAHATAYTLGAPGGAGGAEGGGDDIAAQLAAMLGGDKDKSKREREARKARTALIRRLEGAIAARKAVIDAAMKAFDENDAMTGAQLLARIEAPAKALKDLTLRLARVRADRGVLQAYALGRTPYGTAVGKAREAIGERTDEQAKKRTEDLERQLDKVQEYVDAAQRAGSGPGMLWYAAFAQDLEYKIAKRKGEDLTKFGIGGGAFGEATREVERQVRQTATEQARRYEQQVSTYFQGLLDANADALQDRLHAIEMSTRPDNPFLSPTQQATEEYRRARQRAGATRGSADFLGTLATFAREMGAPADDVKRLTDAFRSLSKEADRAERAVQDLADRSLGDQLRGIIGKIGESADDALFRFQMTEVPVSRADEPRYRMQRMMQERSILLGEQGALFQQAMGGNPYALEEMRRLDRDIQRLDQSIRNEPRQQALAMKEEMASYVSSAFIEWFHGRAGLGDAIRGLGDKLLDAAIDKLVRSAMDPMVTALAANQLAVEGNIDALNALTVTMGGQPTRSTPGGTPPGQQPDGTGGTGGGGRRGPQGLRKPMDRWNTTDYMQAGMAAYAAWMNGAQNGITLGGVIGAGMAGFQMAGLPGAAVGIGLDLLGGLFGHRKPKEPESQKNPAYYNAPSDFEYEAYRFRVTGRSNVANMHFFDSKEPLIHVTIPVYVDGVKTAVRDETQRATSSGKVALASPAYDLHRPL